MAKDHSERSFVCTIVRRSTQSNERTRPRDTSNIPCTVEHDCTNSARPQVYCHDEISFAYSTSRTPTSLDLRVGSTNTLESRSTRNSRIALSM